ncbi:hypothetical protein LJR153_003807 [Paenibacillus sp. LjRoot153]
MKIDPADNDRLIQNEWRLPEQTAASITLMGSIPNMKKYEV